MPPFLIAVHAGAGYHSLENEDGYKRCKFKCDLDARSQSIRWMAKNEIKHNSSLFTSFAVMKNACRAAAESLALKDCALEAVSAAIKILEDDPLTNAGNGSNLTFSGSVECDAMVMAGDGTFGSIAAAPGIKNPCVAATRLAVDSKTPLSHGRVRPMMLAGDAAREWALKEGLEAAKTAEDAAEMHITNKARRQHKKYLDILLENDTDEGDRTSSQRDAGVSNINAKKRQRTSSENDDHDTKPDLFNDTVGCCVVTACGHVASGVSSGGIALKTPGRVGEAAIYGAGCWAEETKDGNGIAVSVTGVGERIMQHLVAKECATRILKLNSDGAGASSKRKSKDSNDALSVCTQFLNETIGSGPKPRDCGVLCAVSSAQEQPGHLHVVLTVVHSESESMAVAWLSEDGQGKQRSESRVLRKANGDGRERHRSSVASQSLVVGVHWPIQPT